MYVFQGSICFVLKRTDEGIHYDHSGIAPLHVVDAMAHYLIAGRDLCVYVFGGLFAVSSLESETYLYSLGLPWI